MSVQKIDLPWRKSEYDIVHSKIILASAYICRKVDNPEEILEMLGIHDDLQKLRVCRRLEKNGTPPRLSRS